MTQDKRIKDRMRKYNLDKEDAEIYVSNEDRMRDIRNATKGIQYLKDEEYRELLVENRIMRGVSPTTGKRPKPDAEASKSEEDTKPKTPDTTKSEVEAAKPKTPDTTKSDAERSGEAASTTPEANAL